MEKVELMQTRIELSESDLRKLIVEHFNKIFAKSDFDSANIVIEVKSTQNYKSEWEVASFRAVYYQVK